MTIMQFHAERETHWINVALSEKVSRTWVSVSEPKCWRVVSGLGSIRDPYARAEIGYHAITGACPDRERCRLA